MHEPTLASALLWGSAVCSGSPVVQIPGEQDGANYGVSRSSHGGLADPFWWAQQVALRGGIPQSPSITSFAAVYGALAEEDSADSAAQRAGPGQPNGQAAPAQPSGGVL